MMFSCKSDFLDLIFTLHLIWFVFFFFACWVGDLGDLTMALPELANAGGVFPPNVPDVGVGWSAEPLPFCVALFGIAAGFPVHKIYSRGGNG